MPARQIQPHDVVDMIGQRQRWRFERFGVMTFGSSVSDLAEELGLSHNTIRSHLNEARRRGFKLLERKRPAVSPTTGAPISGRPTIEYYLVDGHRWAGPGAPLAHAVGVGNASAMADGDGDVGGANSLG